MRTKGKVKVIRDEVPDCTPIQSVRSTTNEGHLICVCYGPDAADNAQFIATAWNEWPEIEQMKKAIAPTKNKEKP